MQEVSRQPTNGGYKEVKMTFGTVAEIATKWPGWQLCDGTNGTPDLRDRFIVGVSADDAGVAKSTITGAALQKHDTGVMPAHTHGYSRTPSVSTNIFAAGSDYGTLDNQNTGSTGTGTKVIAVFYALCFIAKPV